MRRITIEVPVELYSKVRLLAYAEDVTMGTLCRRALNLLCDTSEAHKIRFVDGRNSEGGMET